MNHPYGEPTAPTYRPEKPNHVKTGVKTLFFLVIFHAVTWLLYVLFMSPIENQMILDEHEPEYRFVMFGFSFVTLLVIAIIMTVFYFKNGDRKRAYLAATSAEVRGAENVPEGERRYRKLALTEAIISVAVTAVLWLLPAGFYTAALNASGMGYGYGSAWGIETFFTGIIGFFQPFQNAWVGMLMALAILFCFHYFGRLFSHKSWASNRIRR
ncbi:MAG: hypothetical protein J6K29_07905 [Clostridia bacterium]|nr:hypothetical protein [Clostridia bacterium]